MSKAYVNYTVSKELAEKALQLLEAVKNSGKIRKGTNETTKAVEKSIAKIVFIAEDIEPEEIVMHLPPLCDEKKVPYVFISTKQEIGRATGIDVPMAACAVTDIGKENNNFDDIISSISIAKK